MTNPKPVALPWVCGASGLRTKDEEQDVLSTADPLLAEIEHHQQSQVDRE